MASSDPLLAFRAAISTGGELSSSTKLAIIKEESNPQDTKDIAEATDLIITQPSSHQFPLATPTRFISKDTPVDLRSIFFAYQTKDLEIPEYISEAQAKGLSNLAFVERLDLIAWLEGSSDSEYIKALEGIAAGADGITASQIAAGATGGAAALPAGKGDRLAGIYKHERRLGDRKSVLRGIKPTDFSHVKKTAELLLRKEKPRPGAPKQPISSAPSLPTHPKKPQRRPDPIILLSPSASSLLRMSNIKVFLDSGVYTPPDSNAGVGTLNHITKIIPSIDANRPMRFILVEGPDRFKPDDWNHVVAVFTTGQAWQFKGYRWTEPSELFSKVLGIYVGWKGDGVPSTVKGWGRGVKGVELEKWEGGEGAANRWRDREVVEKLWGEIAEHMRRRGWGRDTGPR